MPSKTIDAKPVSNPRYRGGVSRVVPIRIKATAVKDVEQAAKDRGMNVPTYVRSLIDKDLGVKT